MKHTLKTLVALTLVAVSSLSMAQPQAQVNKSSPAVAPTTPAMQAAPVKPAVKPVLKHAHKKHMHKRHHSHHGAKAGMKRGNPGIYKLKHQIQAGKKDGSLTRSELSLIDSKMQSLQKNLAQAKANRTMYPSEMNFLRAQFKDTFKTVYELRHNKVGKMAKHSKHSKGHKYHGKGKMHKPAAKK